MLARLSAWRAERRRKEKAIRHAVQEFRQGRGFAPMGGHVLRLGPRETIVRVMYMAGRKPPDRAWFAISEADGTVRELTLNDVQHLETPWR
jgi:hypothetical protein